MNFFRIPRYNMTQKELDELVHLHTLTQSLRHLDAHRTTNILLDEFHSRQKNVGISDMRMYRILLMCFPALNRFEKTVIPIVTDRYLAYYGPTDT